MNNLEQNSAYDYMSGYELIDSTLFKQIYLTNDEKWRKKKKAVDFFL